MTDTKVAAESRAVERAVRSGTHEICAQCDTPVRFRARRKFRQVIANVYVDGIWKRVEHFHFNGGPKEGAGECYLLAGEPYGPAAAE